MYMKYYTLYTVLFFSLKVLGQPVNEIKQLLRNKDFISLNSYIEKPQKSNVNFRWETLRTIFEDYKEGIIKIEETKPSYDGTGGSIINNYRVYLLSNEDKFFYYKIINIFYKKIGAEKFEKNESVIDKLKDSTKYTYFENSFKQTYGDALDSNDLFLTSITYGESCGIAGVNPDYLDKLNLCLVTNRISEIRKWLSSANSEKQLYAIRGFRVLINHGYKATEDEKRIINIVVQKKGLVSTCSGCNVMQENFQDVISKINSAPIEYITPIKMNSSYLTSKKQKSDAKNSLLLWGLISLSSISITAFGYFVWRKKKTFNNS